MRREVKEIDVYDLVIAKGGLKIKESSPDEKELHQWHWSRSSIAATEHVSTVMGLANSLSHSAGRMIIDKTGLGDKKFDYELKWSTNEQTTPDADDDAGPSIFKALEEQLGLKLVPAKEPVETFVVDHIEKPTPN